MQMKKNILLLYFIVFTMTAVANVPKVIFVPDKGNGYGYVSESVYGFSSSYGNFVGNEITGEFGVEGVTTMYIAQVFAKHFTEQGYETDIADIEQYNYLDADYAVKIFYSPIKKRGILYARIYKLNSDKQDKLLACFETSKHSRKNLMRYCSMYAADILYEFEKVAQDERIIKKYDYSTADVNRYKSYRAAAITMTAVGSPLTAICISMIVVGVVLPNASGIGLIIGGAIIMELSLPLIFIAIPMWVLAHKYSERISIMNEWDDNKLFAGLRIKL